MDILIRWQRLILISFTMLCDVEYSYKVLQWKTHQLFSPGIYENRKHVCFSYEKNKNTFVSHSDSKLFRINIWVRIAGVFFIGSDVEKNNGNVLLVNTLVEFIVSTNFINIHNFAYKF